MNICNPQIIDRPADSHIVAPQGLKHLTEALRLTNPQTGKLQLGYDRLAGSFGVCRRSAMRIMRGFEQAGFFDKVRTGGWRRGAGGKIIPQVNTWRLDRRRVAAVLGDILDPGEMSPYVALEVPSKAQSPSQNPKTRGERVCKQARTAKPPPEVEPATVEATQKADLRRWIAVPADDERWLAFRDLARPHMLGLAERDLFRTWCRQVRRGADPQAMLDGWRAHLACCKARGSWTKRPDNFVAQRAYELDWPADVPKREPKRKDESFPEKVERRAKACGLYAWPGEEYEDLWRRVLAKEESL